MHSRPQTIWDQVANLHHSWHLTLFSHKNCKHIFVFLRWSHSLRMPGLTRSKGNQGFVPKILILIFHISTKKFEHIFDCGGFCFYCISWKYPCKKGSDGIKTKWKQDTGRASDGIKTTTRFQSGKRRRSVLITVSLSSLACVLIHVLSMPYLKILLSWLLRSFSSNFIASSRELQCPNISIARHTVLYVDKAVEVIVAASIFPEGQML